MSKLAAHTFAAERAGASSVEYAILVSLIALIILVSVTLFGEQTSGLFQTTCTSVASTQGTTC